MLSNTHLDIYIAETAGVILVNGSQKNKVDDIKW